MFYLISCVILGLIILLPTIFAVVSFPESGRFSELWILGSNNIIENRSFNVLLNKFYTVHVGVSNRMGELEYYLIYVKLHTQSEVLANKNTSLPSALEPIYEYRLFLSNNETIEEDFTFSLEDVSFEANISRVSRLSINGQNVEVDKSIIWDDSSNGFYSQFVFELWVYNATISEFEYHNRSVFFWFNITNTI